MIKKSTRAGRRGRPAGSWVHCRRTERCTGDELASVHPPLFITDTPSRPSRPPLHTAAWCRAYRCRRSKASIHSLLSSNMGTTISRPILHAIESGLLGIASIVDRLVRIVDRFFSLIVSTCLSPAVYAHFYVTPPSAAAGTKGDVAAGADELTRVCTDDGVCYVPKTRLREHRLLKKRMEEDRLKRRKMRAEWAAAGLDVAEMERQERDRKAGRLPPNGRPLSVTSMPLFAPPSAVPSRASTPGNSSGQPISTPPQDDKREMEEVGSSSVRLVTSMPSPTTHRNTERLGALKEASYDHGSCLETGDVRFEEGPTPRSSNDRTRLRSMPLFEGNAATGPEARAAKSAAVKTSTMRIGTKPAWRSTWGPTSQSPIEEQLASRVQESHPSAASGAQHAASHDASNRSRAFFHRHTASLPVVHDANGGKGSATPSPQQSVVALASGLPVGRAAPVLVQPKPRRAQKGSQAPFAGAAAMASGNGSSSGRSTPSNASAAPLRQRMQMSGTPPPVSMMSRLHQTSSRNCASLDLSRTSTTQSNGGDPPSRAGFALMRGLTPPLFLNASQQSRSGTPPGTIGLFSSSSATPPPPPPPSLMEIADRACKSRWEANARERKVWKGEVKRIALHRLHNQQQRGAGAGAASAPASAP